MSTKLVITICEMINLPHKKKLSQVLVEYSTLKIPPFKGIDNLMIRLIPLFPYCAVDDSDIITSFLAQFGNICGLPAVCHI